ncbi:MAG: shikimate dehydrogenase, partial [Porticoccus sp.]
MTDQYAVFGNPIAHSKSPLIHAEFAKQTEQDLSYEKMLVELDDFVNRADAFFNSGGKGLNITVPFKLEAY